MKKLLLTCLMMLIGLSASAQISYNYGWEPSGLGSWTTSGSGSFSRSTTTACSGSASARANNYYANSSFLISPALTGTNGGDLSVSFAYKVTKYSSNASGASLADLGTIKVQYATALAGPYTTGLTIDNTTHVESASCATKVATLSGLPSAGDVFVRFEVTSGNSNADNYVYIDDVVISQGVPPSCATPSSITKSNLTTTSADIGWTAPSTAPANGYEVYYSTSSTAPTAATVLDGTNSVSSATTMAVLSGLMPSTQYNVWVRSVCVGSDRSAWLVGGTFNTLCTAFSVPYTENFDTTAVGSSTATNAPNCWTYLETASSAGYGYVIASTPASTPNNYYLYNSSDNTGNIMLVSPQTTNLTNGLNRVRFNARGGSAGYVLQLGTVTNNTDPTTFAAISSITLTSTNTQYIVDIPAGSNTYLAFKHGLGGTFRSIYLDDIIVELIPSCVAPTSPMNTGATSSSLSYSWTAPATAPAIGYQVYYSTTNTAPTAATVLDATNSVSSATTTATISGLPAETVQFVWVRSNCAAADQSVWVSAGSANTGYCVVSTTGQASYFTSLTSSGAITNLAYSNTGSAGISPGYQNLTATNKISNFAGSTTNIGIGLAGTTVGVTIWVDWNNNLIFETTEKVFGTTGYVSTISGASITAPVGTAIGNYRTRAVVNYNNGTPSNPCEIVTRGEYIDFTFEVTAPPSCLAPTALVVSGTTTTGATISWTASSSNPTNGYEIYYSTTNTAPTAATTPSVTGITGTSTTVSGLASSTSYYMWVRANCAAADQSAWSLSAVASTSCATTTVPYNVDFETATVGGTEPCTTLENAGTGNNWAVKNNNGYGFTTNALVYTYNGTNAANAWFYTNGITLPVGAYTITYDYGSTSFDEKLKVAYGTSATAAAMTNVIATYDPVTPKGVKNTASLDVNITTAGVYYFGFNAFSDADQLYLAIDNISIIAKPLATTDIVKEDRTFSIAPNPFTDVVRISDLKDVVSISIVDLSGRIVKTVKPAREIQLGDLKTGMYLINLKMKDGSVQTVKAIKK